MIKHLIHIAIYFCLSLYTASANDFLFQSFNINDGLSNSTVNTIYQSKNKLIWIGTQRGIDLFTGKSFIPLDHFIADSTHLVQTSITAIAELNSNTLWAGTWGDGVFNVNIETGEYHHYHVKDEIKSNTVSDNYINCMYAADGDLWIGSSYCLSHTKGDGHFTHYCFSEVLSKKSPNIRGIIPKYEHLLSIFTNNGEIVELNTQSKTYTKVSEINTLTNNITSIKKDLSGRYWVATEFNGIIVLDENYQEIALSPALKEAIQRSHVSGIAIHPEGEILLSSDGKGLIIVNPDNLSIQILNHSPYDSNSLQSNQLQSILFDSEGILWVGYYKGGFSKTMYKSDGISHFYKTGTKKGLLPNKNVNCFTEDMDNNIWIGTESGIAILGQDLQPVKSKPIHKQIKRNFRNLPITTLNNNKKKDKIFIGSYNSGLFLADLKSNKITNYNKSNSNLTSNFIRDIKEVNDTLIYVTTINGGFYRFNGEKFKRIKVYYDNRFELKDFIHIEIVDDKTLWLSSAGKGPIRISDSISSGELFEGLGSTICYCTYATSDSCVFLATNKGIFKYNASQNEFHTFSTASQNSDYFGILEANDSSLWISSSTGLLKYDREKKEFKKIVSSSLRNREFLPGAYHKLSDGRLLFGGTNGFNIIEPDNYYIYNGNPSIFISNFKVYNQHIKPGTKYNNTIQLSQQVNFVDELHIPADINLFSINTAVINYLNYNHSTIAYTINKGSKESELLYTHGEISFLDLNPGNYTISIYPVNELTNKVLLDNGRTIAIYKAKPWWMKTGFYTSMLLLILITIIYLHKLRTRKYKKTKLLLEKAVSEKTATLFSQKEALQKQRDELEKMLHENEKLESFKESMINMIIHDLKNPLNGIIGLSSLNEADYLEHINSASRQMLYLVENILDVRRYETHSLQLFYQMSDIRQLFNEAIDDVRFLLKDSDIEIINLVSPIQIQVDKDIMRRVFINLLTNAIKYSPAQGKIHLKSEINEVEKEKSLLLSVQDEGNGILPQYKDSIFDLYKQVDTKKSGQTNSNGLGLSFCKIAVEEHNSSIWVESETGQGSTFFIQLPLNKV